MQQEQREKMMSTLRRAGMLRAVAKQYVDGVEAAQAGITKPPMYLEPKESIWWMAGNNDEMMSQ